MNITMMEQRSFMQTGLSGNQQENEQRWSGIRLGVQVFLVGILNARQCQCDI